VKHQWMRYPAFPPDEGYVGCLACGKVATIIDGHIGVAIATEDCPDPYTAAAELLSVPSLTMIDDDLWVSPVHVVGAKVWESIEYDGETEAFSSYIAAKVVRRDHWTRLMTERRDFEVHKPLHEVVALINGSA
jgi:hypothetical protein